MKMSRTRIALGDMFEIFVDESRMMRSRHLMAAEYEGLYGSILQCILQEKILHIDETSVKLRGLKGYVWVLPAWTKCITSISHPGRALFSKRCSIPSPVF